MEFRIADTFSDSLSKLSNDEQKAVKTTAFDLQLNPAQPGMQFHKLGKAKDKNFWSVRVSRNIRVIVHKTDVSLMLCYVDHHDAAYQWAERRKLERHPKTGAAQLVEVRETVREIAVPRYVDVPVAPEPVAPGLTAPARQLFEDVSEDDLLGYGVPPEWMADVKAATEDSVLELADHLPAEAAEALLEIATDNTPAVPVHAAAEADPFEHPDAQRRFRVMTDKDELERALDFPWEKWTVFLHPAQRRIVEREFSGPTRVAGSAGTGKTIVALHRAVHLARRHPDARVLLTTFSETLANALRVKLRRLIGNEPRLAERLDVLSMEGQPRSRTPSLVAGRWTRNGLSTPTKRSTASAGAASSHAGSWTSPSALSRASGYGKRLSGRAATRRYFSLTPRRRSSAGGCQRDTAVVVATGLFASSRRRAWMAHMFGDSALFT